MTEFYFIPDQVKDQNRKLEYFIKLSKGKVSREEIKKHIEKSLGVKGFFLKGLWYADDNTDQRRFGDYLILFLFFRLYFAINMNLLLNLYVV
jgi:hypothetical protein